MVLVSRASKGLAVEVMVVGAGGLGGGGMVAGIGKMVAAVSARVIKACALFGLTRSFYEAKMIMFDPSQ